MHTYRSESTKELCVKSIPSSVQYVTLKKKVFFTSKFRYLLSCNPSHETETGGGTTNSNPPGPIIMMSQSETLSSIQITFSILFGHVHKLVVDVCVLPANAKCTTMLSQNHFLELNRHILTLLHPILMCRSHIVSTDRDALKANYLLRHTG